MTRVEGTMLLRSLSLLALMFRTVLADPEGDNVCSRSETYTVSLPVWVKEPVQVKTYTWCLGVPPRCTKYRTEMRDKLKIQTAVRERVVMVCCRGYALDRNETHCIPVCKEGGCLHGLCVSPDTCRCAAGYTGIHCDRECENSRWGMDCTQPCLCKNDAHCNHVTGDCKCEPGWRGTTCETPCPRGTYGDACMEECQCLSGNCDHITGECYHKTPLYEEGRTITTLKQTTTSVPVTSAEVEVLQNYTVASNARENLTPTPTQGQSDKTTVPANLEVRQETNVPKGSVTQTSKEEIEDHDSDNIKISSEETAGMDKSKEHMVQPGEDGDTLRHTPYVENESTEAVNEEDTITNEAEDMETSREENIEEEKEGSVNTDDNETGNLEHEWAMEDKDTVNPPSDNNNADTEDSQFNSAKKEKEHEEDDEEEEDHEIFNRINTENKQESGQGIQETSPPEIIYVSDGLQGDSEDAGTLGLIFSVSIGGGMALALIIMAAAVIFTVSRRRRSGKQNLQAATDVGPTTVPAPIHYTSDVSTLPLPQLFLGSEYQNSVINEMPLHTLRDSESHLPARYGEATLTTFGRPNQLSQEENRTTRAFLELQYDIPPSAIASKNNSILPGEEPEHVYDEIPAWRNAGEC